MQDSQYSSHLREHFVRAHGYGWNCGGEFDSVCLIKMLLILTLLKQL